MKKLKLLLVQVRWVNSYQKNLQNHVCIHDFTVELSLTHTSGLLKARGGGLRGQKIRFFLFLLVVSSSRGGSCGTKLAAKEIAFTQKLRFTFSFEI